MGLQDLQQAKASKVLILCFSVLNRSLIDSIRKNTEHLTIHEEGYLNDLNRKFILSLSSSLSFLHLNHADRSTALPSLRMKI